MLNSIITKAAGKIIMPALLLSMGIVGNIESTAHVNGWASTIDIKSDVVHLYPQKWDVCYDIDTKGSIWQDFLADPDHDVDNIVITIDTKGTMSFEDDEVLKIK